jgi:Family of unknown function (DUF5754)
MCKVSLKKSTNVNKKMMATFEDCKTFRTKTVHFGATGYSDYTIHKDPQRKERYLARHNRGNEDWENPYTAGSLSRYILWNKTSLQESIQDYKRRFKFT